MIKECVILDGKIINIGPWDYQYQEINDQQVVQNPMPEGATTENRDVEYNANRGWYEVGIIAAPSIEERLESTEAAILAIMEGLG